MQELWISVGRHRQEKHWKNKQITWTELVDRLRDCKYTGETVKEYAAMSKYEQDVIKDVGGFVGGVINGGRRIKGAVTSRSVVTLDLDNAPAGFWGEFSLFYGCAAAIYSTHKHTPESPRLRLIMPLDREVLPDEYEALTRWLAGDIGLEYFDPTTFQPERLMYWPSMPKDGQYLFEVQDGEPICADKILAKYKDWKDISQWPVHDTVKRKIGEAVKTAQDPTEKTGIVGAFCRVYGIEAAIDTFLSETYSKVQDGRYTYSHGSTAGGLVVYDDKFAYSHHGTDPCSGILCNAFDLVRIHKFGDMDSKVKEGTPINKIPSFGAMSDFVRGIKEVNLDLVKQQTGRAQEAFEGVENDEWLKLLETDRRGKIVPTAENILIILRNDPVLKGKFALNSFTNRVIVWGSLPWNNNLFDRVFADVDDAGLRWYIETVYKITAVNKIYDCVAMVVLENQFHPVRQYLEGLVWDGKERIDTLLIDYFGAEDNPYIRAVMRKTLIGAVARIMQPGIKFDNVLVLVGPQGAGKSTFISKLGQNWYSDNFGRLDNKDAMENIQGVWIMEIGELAGIKRAEIEVIKHFISKQIDEFRPPYGRKVQQFPRQCIFIGSTNDDHFIQDQTGGRRFWPVKIFKNADNIFKKLNREDINQIWAEAVQGWLYDDSLHLPKEIEMLAEAIQSDHTEKDPWKEAIERYLETPLPDNWDNLPLYDKKAFLRGDDTQPKGLKLRQNVTAYEIWFECLEGDRKSLTTGIGRRISAIMKKIEGWEMAPKKGKFDGMTVKFYERKIGCQ